MVPNSRIGMGLAAALLLPLIVTGCITGDGPLVSEQREVGSFRHVEVGSGIRLALSTGVAGPVVVEAQGNIVPAVETSVSGQTLRIEASRDFTSLQPVTVTVSTPDLESITLTGGTAATIAGLDADELEVAVRGGARITATGRVGDVHLVAGGGSNVDLRDLEADSVTLDISGASNATVTASGVVSGSASGASQLAVWGPATVDVATSGGAAVAQRNP